MKYLKQKIYIFMSLTCDFFLRFSCTVPATALTFLHISSPEFPDADVRNCSHAVMQRQTRLDAK